jgi:hypothetical protein
MAVFPKNLVPNWIDRVAQPKRPTISQRFQSGADSDLRLSSIPTGGEIKAEFFLTTIQLQDLENFWAEVEDTVSFTLLERFFPISCHPDFIQRLKAYSPTGWWRFKEQPQIETHPSLMASVSIVLRGAIL